MLESGVLPGLPRGHLHLRTPGPPGRLHTSEWLVCEWIGRVHVFPGQLHPSVWVRNRFQENATVAVPLGRFIDDVAEPPLDVFHFPSRAAELLLVALVAHEKVLGP